jgi:PAS domain S-box-containing protein
VLRESEERYRVIVESTRELILFLDQEGRLRWCNPASRELIGDVAPEGEPFGRVHPADAPRVAAAWLAARRGGEGGPDKFSYRLRGVDGGYRTLESSFRKISLSGEELWCIISTDTTELTRLRKKATARQGITGMVGRDPKMLELAASIRDLAEEDVPVLILGESGTGKELIASAIHQEGSRAGKRFVAINCGAIPDTLLETELFGHVKGSFTGAHRDKKGRFELADGGTIFLDEVSELSLTMQVKLLRVLQEGTFEKVGGEEPCRVDVRLISATNKDLKQEVKANRFREDLYYRISVVPLAVPPLRERLADIPLLVEHILDEEARRSDRRRDPSRSPREVSLAREALALLLAHRWPGNIRELQNVLRFALIKCKGNLIGPEHLPPSFAAPRQDICRVKGRKPKISAESAAKALEQAGGHPGEAARSLGVSRATFYRHLPKDGK